MYRYESIINGLPRPGCTEDVIITRVINNYLTETCEMCILMYFSFNSQNKMVM